MKKPCQARSSRCESNAGFTLIELLTVIAIIAILAGLTAVAVPQYLNKAKEIQTISNMKSVADALAVYSARVENKFGYPPAYGYILNEERDRDVGALNDAHHVLIPYTFSVGIHGAKDVYEVLGYANSSDSNGDGALSLFEYLPIGSLNAAAGTYEFSTTLYTTFNTPRSPEPGGLDEVQAQLAPDVSRPYAYIPYNKRQLNTLTRYWLDKDIRDEFGAGFDPAHPIVAGRLFFPPPEYDAFVLIGNGPGGNEGGLLSVDPPGTPGPDYSPRHTYHMLGLRIAFLATRDLDPDYDGPDQADGLLDFSYEDRKQATRINVFPNGTNGQGPFIKVVQ